METKTYDNKASKEEAKDNKEAAKEEQRVDKEEAKEAKEVAKEEKLVEKALEGKDPYEQIQVLVKEGRLGIRP